jgi:hypothetical protein
MSATMKPTPWNEPIGRPNCSRVWAYGIARIEGGLGEPDRHRTDRDPTAVEDP